MNKEKKIKNFEDFKSAWGRTSRYHQLREFHQNDPGKYEEFRNKFEKEKLREHDPVSYYFQYVLPKKDGRNSAAGGR